MDNKGAGTIEWILACLVLIVLLLIFRDRLIQWLGLLFGGL